MQKLCQDILIFYAGSSAEEVDKLASSFFYWKKKYSCTNGTFWNDLSWNYIVSTFFICLSWGIIWDFYNPLAYYLFKWVEIEFSFTKKNVVGLWFRLTIYNLAMKMANAFVHLGLFG